MRGVGPTTRAAVARYQPERASSAASGDTNGALMRILPAGWAIPATHAERRRDVVTRLTQVTHGGTAAVAAACAVAAMASYALDGCPRRRSITVAFDEFDHGWGSTPRLPFGCETAQAAGQGTWRPGAGGVPLDAAGDPRRRRACPGHVRGGRGRGDAVCGRPGRGHRHRRGDHRRHPRLPEREVEIGWLDRVILPDAAELDRLAGGLREMRRAAYG